MHLRRGLCESGFDTFNEVMSPASIFGVYHGLLAGYDTAIAKLDAVREGFAETMGDAFESMWARKLGLRNFDETLVQELLQLMIAADADYTMFFRKLSHIPEKIDNLKESFYSPSSEEIDLRLTNWLQRWHKLLINDGDLEKTSASMKKVNPKYAWREWLVVPAYQLAEHGDYSLIRELQTVFTNPYDEQSPEIESKYDRLRPKEFFQAGGVSHYSCSS